MEIPTDLMEPLVQAVIALLTALVALVAWWMKQLLNTQMEIKNEVQSSNALTGQILISDSEYQSEAGMKAMMEKIPCDASIQKVEEGIASNGSKYRIIYWRRVVR